MLLLAQLLPLELLLLVLLLLLIRMVCSQLVELQYIITNSNNKIYGGPWIGDVYRYNRVVAGTDAVVIVASVFIFIFSRVSAHSSSIICCALVYGGGDIHNFSVIFIKGTPFPNPLIYTVMMEFEEIDFHIKNDGLDKLIRSPQEQEIYRRSLAKTREEWESISDFILHSKFKLAFCVSSAGKKYVPRDSITPAELCIKNDFPYNFADDVMHMVFWKIGGEVVMDDLHNAIEALQHTYSVKRYTVFINPPNLKSIADLSHGHIVLQLHTKNPFVVRSFGNLGRAVALFGGIVFTTFVVKYYFSKK
jgi:hypothetical protein